jgi:hypothetical protein
MKLKIFILKNPKTDSKIYYGKQLKSLGLKKFLILDIEEGVEQMNEKKDDKKEESTSPITLRAAVLGEIKESIPSVKNGSYLKKPNEEEIKSREIERNKRKEELKEVEKAYKKTKQVKFLTNASELDDIKYYAQLSHQTKSEFIRTAIRDKIRLMEAQLSEKSLNELEDTQEHKLSLEELKKIRKALERLEKKE